MVTARFRWLLVVSLLAHAIGVGSAADDADDDAHDDGMGRRGSHLRALADVAIVSSGIGTPSSVAVQSDGAILVTDQDAGTLVRIDEAGRRTVLLRHLRRPAGVAIDPGRGVLVLEQGRDRVLRLAADGTVAVVASDLRQARALTVGPGGRIWVALRRATGRARDDDDDRKSEYVVVLVDESGARTTFASGFMGLQGLAADANALYIVMAGLATDRGRAHTTLARIAIRADGKAGSVESLLRNSPDRPSGIAIDAGGDVFVAGTSREDGHRRDDDRGGLILKRRPDGRVGTFATGLRDSLALAFAPNGDLVVVEQARAGRLLRFVAPPAPALAVQGFANTGQATVDGTAAGGAQVTVARLDSPWSLAGSTVAGTAGGRFSFDLPMEPNAANSFTVGATGAGGGGLRGRPLVFEIVHDDVPPWLMILGPMPGAHTRGPVLSTAQAGDERSGVASLLWSVDGADIVHLENPVPGQPFSGTTVLATGGLPEGAHVMDVVAADRAGNHRIASAPIIVDRTPPETVIVSGPAPAISEKTAAFSVSGHDAWSSIGQLDYSWRLDAGTWSPFDASGSVTFDDLLPGEHRFEARARDRAGNEDATPVAQTFVVRSLRVQILEPAPGTVVTTGSVWVRARVEGGTGEVTASVPLPSQPGVPVVTAPVQGDTVAIEVPVDPALTTLTVVAADANGATAQAEVPIVVIAGAMTVEPGLELWPPGGLAPLTVRVGLSGWLGSHLAIDVDGDGTNEFEGLSDADDFSATYERAGVYLPSVRITTPDGEVLTRRGVVEVYDPVVLETRLQAAWTGFKDALRDASVQTAVSFIAAERRAAWAEYFAALPPEALADVDLLFTTMTLVEVGYGGAQYEMLAERDGLIYSYAVWFRIDEDGRWRLWRF